MNKSFSELKQKCQAFDQVTTDDKVIAENYKLDNDKLVKTNEKYKQKIEVLKFKETKLERMWSKLKKKFKCDKQHIKNYYTKEINTSNKK